MTNATDNTTEYSECECGICEFEADSAARLDVAVAEGASVTRSCAAKYIADGLVCVDGKAVTAKSFEVKPGQTITVTLPEAKECTATPEDIPLDIVYEDSDLLVVNKPQGMVVHPAPGNYDGTLVNALLHHCKGSLSGINGVIRPGIVHRIDKDTSGLLIVAKNDASHIGLASQIKEHSFTRKYRAIVHGNIKEDTGTVNLPIGRNPSDRKKMAVTSKNSKEAVTHFEVLERFGRFTYVEFTLETGRTHQIRVHSSHGGHAVVGDPLYAPQGGKNPFGLKGQCLHAATIGFVHPSTSEYLEFTSSLPAHFEKVLDTLRKTI